MTRMLPLLVSLWGSIGGAQEGALDDVVHAPAPCMSTEAFPLLEVKASTADVARARRLTVRFRSEEDDGWYEVELPSASGLTVQAALPKPTDDAVRVHYYFASGRPELRTSEYIVNVLAGGCPGARSAPAQMTERIRVRTTASGQGEIPRGFSAEGIRTGGMSGTTVGIVAGAAGAGVAALLASGGEDVAPPPGPGNPQAIRACFMPDPTPEIESGGTIVFDASCSSPSTISSYQWDFGDRSTGQGRSIEHLFRPGGLYTVTLTVSDGQRTDRVSRLVNVIATPVACFVTTPNPPRIFVNGSIDFNAECSVGDRDGGPTFITAYNWDFGDGDDGGVGRFVSHLYTQPDLYGVTLTVTNEDGRRERTTQFVVVERRGSGSGSLEVSFTSELRLPTGAAAQIGVNDSETISAVSSAPQRHRARARSGENVVEGRLLSESSEPGEWRFDFREAAGFVPGSLRVDSGDVLVLESASVVFRVTGKPGGPVRFRFRYEEK